jgi:hypothetical protein
MNPKTVSVALMSAVFAAGLTYWVVAPMRNGTQTPATARMTPPPVESGPPLVISKVEPPQRTEVLPPDHTPIRTAAAKPSPMVPQEPVTEAPPPVEVPTAAPVQPQPEPAPPPPVVVSPAPPPRPAPPERVALNPPKEVDRAEPAILREPSGPNTTTIAQGTLMIVRLGESISSQKNLTGDTFFATLDQPLVAGGFIIAEKGARVEGKLVEVDKVKGIGGTARISLELTQLNTSDGQHIHVQTSTFS